MENVKEIVYITQTSAQGAYPFLQVISSAGRKQMVDSRGAFDYNKTNLQVIYRTGSYGC